VFSNFITLVVFLMDVSVLLVGFETLNLVCWFVYIVLCSGSCCVSNFITLVGFLMDVFILSLYLFD
jgi:hypothetical protein